MRYSPVTKNRLLVAILAISMILSTDVFVVFADVSAYASINTEDIAILFLGLYFAYDVAANDRDLVLRSPRVTAILLVVTTWILISNIFTNLYFGIPATASYLWFIKWIEVVVFFILMQTVVRSESSKTVVYIIVVLGVLISLYGILLYDGDRVRIVFGNPNALASFLILPGLLCLSLAVYRAKFVYLYLLGFVVISTGIFFTGSRSGLLGFITGIVVLSLITVGKVTLNRILMLLFSFVTLIFLVPIVLSGRAERRFTDWFDIRGTSIQLAEGGGASPINKRIENSRLAGDLFMESPIFGHGWYASPSRIIHLDVHYTTLLVEVGLIGFVLFMILYAVIIIEFRRVFIKGSYVIGSVGISWFIGLLVHSIGGNPTTTPHLLFIVLLFLICGVVQIQKDAND